MSGYFEELIKDWRFREGLKTCINCGTCTAVCPAAEFYRYDPRKIMDAVQRRDDAAIGQLLESDTIWYCGECMSCMTRCPRGNAPGKVIMALRALSIRKGLFTCSERGRQVYPLSQALVGNILKYGYCIYPDTFSFEDHPESGPVWKWHLDHKEASYARMGANYKGRGPGALRLMDPADLKELKAIFDVSGGTEFTEIIEENSRRKAAEMGMTMEQYRKHTFEYTSDKHFNE